eukprot:scaffold294_cov221-Amphora_coffeaeformis.AAC.7
MSTYERTPGRTLRQSVRSKAKKRNPSQSVSTEPYPITSWALLELCSSHQKAAHTPIRPPTGFSIRLAREFFIRPDQSWCVGHGVDSVCPNNDNDNQRKRENAETRALGVKGEGRTDLFVVATGFD